MAGRNELTSLSKECASFCDKYIPEFTAIRDNINNLLQKIDEAKSLGYYQLAFTWLKHLTNTITNKEYGDITTYAEQHKEALNEGVRKEKIMLRFNKKETN